MITRSFGKLSDGRSAGLYILRNRNGMEVHLTDYGAAIVSIMSLTESAMRLLT